MSEQILLIDVPSLAHAGFHAAKGDLDTDGDGLGGIFIALQSITGLADLFCTSSLLFCFEGGTEESKRRELLPGYKSSRKTREKQLTPPELASKKAFYRALRFLPTMMKDHGLVVACQPAYEADDMLALAAQHCTATEQEAVIVTSDDDLLQCLSPYVVTYSPRKKVPVRDMAWFQAEYGLPPSRFPSVKAIAGCSTDDIPGVNGVGEVKAAKYLSGQMNPETATWASIKAAVDSGACRKNMPLVRLPFAGAELPCEMDSWKGTWTDETRKALYEAYGFSTARE